ncbi:hypothetical protein [Micromonospora tulbaghiae]|nr:hypothetical protein [Micromonospora tulbaghiae]MDX5456332.1 hypothetical protein [Micromonospora tulbaghiae]
MLLVLLAGCSNPGTGQQAVDDDEIRPSVSTSSEKDQGSPQITEREYEAAVSQMASCMAKSGVDLINDGWDPIDHEGMILRYKSPGMSGEASSKVYHRCREAHLDNVQKGFNATNKSRMAPDLMAEVRTCLTAKAIMLKGGEKNPADLTRSVPEGRYETLLDCVYGGVRKLYPRLVAVSFP